jgi:hypothetical protein
MELVNLSAEPLGKLHSWIPHELKAEKIVFLPDACPGKSPLPTGTAVLTHQSNWRQFAVSDCGCGMRLVRSTVEAAGLDVGGISRRSSEQRPTWNPCPRRTCLINAAVTGNLNLIVWYSDLTIAEFLARPACGTTTLACQPSK